jgi:hypothetical protein
MDDFDGLTASTLQQPMAEPPLDYLYESELELKKITIRWPKILLDKITSIAETHNISLQTCITLCVLKVANINGWKQPTEKNRRKQIDEILETYKEIPQDILWAVANAKITRSNPGATVTIISDKDATVQAILNEYEDRGGT